MLKQIYATGSMLGAAKSMKMGYKATWDTLNQMNELSSLPLLEKNTGGKGGGGTRLTPYARELIGTFEKFDELHKSFMERFKKAGDDPAKLPTILNRTFLTTSARNQFLCKIKDIQEGKVVSIEKSELGDEVHLKIHEDIMLIALIKEDERLS